MRPPRLRIRTLMILVAVVALGLFVEQTRRRWRLYREKAAVFEYVEQAPLRGEVQLSCGRMP